MRIALGIEYDGSPYCGWQYQADADNVQVHVEAALSRVADHKVTAICAGRTDRGVHAASQVIHIDVNVERSMRAWVLGGNVNLPRTIGILWAQPVNEQFHARFSARARHYRYLILNRTVRPGLLHQRVTWEHHPLDIELMQKGANYLLGTHDFTSYRAVACQAKNPVRTVHYLRIHQHEDLVTVEIGANGFLHHMVRNIVGVLLKIGRKECPPEWANTVLIAKDRTAGGMTAPAYGLYFYGVDYDAPFHFPRANTLLPIL